MKNKTIKQKFVDLFMLSIFFDSYSIANIGSYSITVFTIILVIFILYSVLNTNGFKIIKIPKRSIFSIVFMAYIVFDTLITGMTNLTSPLKAISFFTIATLIYRKEDEWCFDHHVKLFSNMMNAMAIYGIYQLIGRMYGLPLANIVINNHMVPGYNWTNVEYTFGASVYRSNAIFLEPSFFSQFLAINILLLISKILQGERTRINIIALIVNALALITTFSGTGLLIFFIGLIVYALKEKNKKVIRKIISLSIIGVLLCAIIFSISSNSDMVTLIRYFIFRRASELTGARGTQASGYIRFISGFRVIKNIWSSKIISCLFGGGMGSSEYFNNLYGGTISNMGYMKVAGELGLIGLVLYLIYLKITFKDSGNYRNRQVLVIAIAIMIACHEGFLQNYDWVLLYLVNIETINKADTGKLAVPIIKYTSNNSNN